MYAKAMKLLGIDTCLGLELVLSMQKTATGFLSVLMAGSQYCKSPQCIYFVIFQLVYDLLIVLIIMVS